MKSILFLVLAALVATGLSCESDQVTITVTMATQSYGSECGWTLYDGGSDILSRQYGTYNSYSQTVEEFCVQKKDGYKLVLRDSYGDGWHGGTITIQAPSTCGDFFVSTGGGHENWPTWDYPGDLNLLCDSGGDSGGDGVTCADPTMAVVKATYVTAADANSTSFNIQSESGNVYFSVGTSELPSDGTNYWWAVCVPIDLRMNVIVSSMVDGVIYIESGHTTVMQIRTPGTYGPFLSTAEDMSEFTVLEATGSSYFNGEYQPIRKTEISGVTYATYVRLSKPDGEYSGSTWYLYASEYYQGYWLIGANDFNTQYYGYLYEPGTANPTEFTTGWYGSYFADFVFNELFPGSPTSPATSSPPSPPPPSPSPSPPPPSSSPAPSPPPPSPSPSPPPPSPSPSPPPSSSSPSPPPVPSTGDFWQCPDLYSNKASDIGACASWSQCGCDDENDQDCDMCCRSTADGSQCYSPQPKFHKEDLDHPYALNGCSNFGCTDAMLNNDVCDPECNKPDCALSGQTFGSNAWDNGMCCSSSGGSATSDNPLICNDPAYSETEMGGGWRFDYNVPRCRKMAMNQGSCGSCYAFAASAVAAHGACLEEAGTHDGNKPMVDVEVLSPMYQDSCVATQYGHGLCEGGVVQYMMRQFTTKGNPTESCYPYAYGGDPEGHFETTSSTIYSCDEVKSVYNAGPAGCTTETDWWLTKGSNNNPWGHLSMNGQASASQQIKDYLKEQGALGFTYDVFSTFMDYDFSQGPNYPYSTTTPGFPGSQQGGHAVALVGWTVLQKAGGHTREVWVLQNSWENTWGDDGYFYLAMEDDWESRMGATVIYYQNANDQWTVTSQNYRKLLSLEESNPAKVNWEAEARPVNKLRRALLQSTSSFNPGATDFPVRDVITHEDETADDAINMLSSAIGTLTGAKCNTTEMIQKYESLKSFLQTSAVEDVTDLVNQYEFVEFIDCSNQIVTPGDNVSKIDFAVKVKEIATGVISTYEIYGVGTVDSTADPAVSGTDVDYTKAYSYSEYGFKKIESTNPGSTTNSETIAPPPPEDDGASRLTSVAFMAVVGFLVFIM